MAKLGIEIPCYQGGNSIITLSFNGTRAGGSDDSGIFRCVRRITGSADVILAGSLYFRLGNIRDSRSWTWLDVGLPTTATYNYIIQVMATTGGGSFQDMQLVGFHLKR